MLHPPFDLNPNHGKLPPWCGCSTNTSIGSHPNPELPTSFPWTSAQKAPHKTHKHFVEEPDCFDSCQLGTPVWSYLRSQKNSLGDSRLKRNEAPNHPGPMKPQMASSSTPPKRWPDHDRPTLYPSAAQRRMATLKLLSMGPSWGTFHSEAGGVAAVRDG